MLTLTAQAKILEVISKQWKMEDREGVSHNVRLLTGDEIFKVKSTEELNKSLEASVGKTGTATLELSSPREAVKLSIVKFEAK